MNENKLKYYRITRAVALIAIFVTGACAMLSTDILEFAKNSMLFIVNIVIYLHNEHTN